MFLRPSGVNILSDSPATAAGGVRRLTLRFGNVSEVSSRGSLQRAGAMLARPQIESSGLCGVFLNRMENS